jgi:hypothetical protein
MNQKLRSEQQGSDKINLHERWEIQYWTERMGITDDQLREAVRLAGPTEREVRSYLNGIR